uniref:Uncharacterized protein n=1 Tax=viral metagenome TaxID=1070528 RepID=A0A6M3XT38_9ZZZZ
MNYNTAIQFINELQKHLSLINGRITLMYHPFNKDYWLIDILKDNKRIFSSQLVYKKYLMFIYTNGDYEIMYKTKIFSDKTVLKMYKYVRAAFILHVMLSGGI